MKKLNNLYVYLTWKCNLFCKHCWVNASMNEQQELDTATVLNICDEAMDLGVRFIKFSGGEPLMCADQLLTAAKHIKSKKESVELHLETNATLITPEIAKELTLFNSISVSLDSAQPEVHNSIRQNSTAFERAMQGINYLTANNINTGVTSVISNPKDIDYHIDSLLTLLKPMGVHRLKVNPIMRNGRAEQGQTEFYNIDPLEMLNIQSKYISSKDIDVFIMLPCAFNLNPGNISKSRLHSCDCLSLISVLPNGDVGLCGEARKATELMFGNIYDNSLSYLWEHSEKLLELRRAIPNHLTGVCKTCLLRAVCKGGCRVDGLLSGGNISSSSYICQTMYERGLFPYSANK